jgi:hypothetical protein
MLRTALNSKANGDKIAFGVLGINPSAFTVMGWSRTTNFGAGGRSWCAHIDGTTGGWSIQFTAGGLMSINWNRASVQCNYITNSLAMLLNRPYFIAFFCDQNAAAGQLVKVAIGDPHVPATFATFGTATDGSGAFNSTVGSDFQWASRKSSSSGAHLGHDSSCVYVPRLLSLADAIDWQFRYGPICGETLRARFGRHGYGVVHDESGNGHHGVVTGSVLSSLGVPLRQPLRRLQYRVPASFRPAWAVGASQLLSGGYGA